MRTKDWWMAAFNIFMIALCAALLAWRLTW